MTETEDAPQEWTEKTIEEITNLQRDNIPSDEQGGLPHVGLEHLEQFSPRISSESSENVSSNKYKFERGDILFGQIRSYLEKVCIADRDGVCSTDIFVIEPDEVNRWYLWSLLLSDDVNRWSQRASTGTKMPRVQWDAFSNKHVSVPPVGEQERIASVLYTVDKHVEALDQRHSDLQDLKHALMQDLISPDEDWVEKKTHEIAKLNPESFSPDEHEEEYLPYLSLSCVSSGQLVDVESTSVSDPVGSATRVVREGDILIGTVRPKQESHYLVTHSEDEYIASSGFVVMRPEDIDSEYLGQVVLSDNFYNQMEAWATGSTYPTVNLSDVKNMTIPVPPKDEQERIASVLYTVDEMIAQTSELRDEYEQAKRGLMQDLLSGEVRTPNSLQPTEAVMA